MQTITNNHWRNFVDSYDVPAQVLADQFDYLDQDDSGGMFFQYRNYWYHISDFMAPTNGAPDDLKEWDGFHADSYFSGVAIKLSADGEQYQVALLLS